jgi:hypothetical protein
MCKTSQQRINFTTITTLQNQLLKCPVAAQSALWRFYTTLSLYIFRRSSFCGCMCRLLWYAFNCAFHFKHHTMFAVGSSLTRNLIFEVCSRGVILLTCEGTETLENCLLSSLGHFLIGFVYYVGFHNKCSLSYTLFHIHKQRAIYIKIKGVCTAQHLLPYS